MINPFITRLTIYCSILLCFSFCQDNNGEKPLIPLEFNEPKFSGAGLSMDEWMLLRSYPNGFINMSAYSRAFQQKKAQEMSRSGAVANWKAIGPKNIGGRTLCLAFDPNDPNVIYAGSAGGGLWKTTTAGSGYYAWTPIATGFPVISVPTIAIDPGNPDVMYIGTGEVYNYVAAAPGQVSRVTRGSYGIGILKTTDGGETWAPSLDWSLSDMRGVQKIIINPLNANSLLAATTEGLLSSHNAGASWENVNDLKMAVDIQISPADTNIVLVSFGSMNSPDKGVYRSVDGGNNFTLVPLNNTYTGKTKLAFSKSNPNIVYASVADEFEGLGLYHSDDAGQSWALVNQQDVPLYQGWYSHDIAVNPTNANNLIYVGVEAWTSTNGGLSLSQKSYWDAWYFGQVPVGGPEGPGEYVHADIHAAYYHPDQNNVIYLATDGGIFVSMDNGNSFEGRNGSYQTQQFYSNFSNSTTDSLYAIGGMQDNATAFYTGDEAWTRVIGGDGMSTAINPFDDNIVYGTSQRLNIRRADDGVNFFTSVTPPGSQNQDRAFNAPYELAPSNPSILYAGTTSLYRSDDNGDNWTIPTTDMDAGNIIFKIAIAPDDEELLYVSTVPNPFVPNSLPGKVFKSTNGGTNWTPMSGLPNHPVSDITFHPDNPDIVFLTYSGFGVNHVWKTEDGGTNWVSIGESLPDVPTNSILVLTQFGTDLYVGNDLGVYHSADGGQNWEPFTEGLPDATMVMDVTFSVANQKLRIATHGHGIWESGLSVPVGLENITKLLQAEVKVFPNPVSDQTYVRFKAAEIMNQLQLSLFKSDGTLIWKKEMAKVGLEEVSWEVDMQPYAAGAYFLLVENKRGERKGLRLVKM
jgi:photosystem II stability/assembly factor-like uncharacterized protein